MIYRIALNIFIGLVLGALLFTQLNVAAVLAVGNDNPITSAITSAIVAITNPTPPPMTAPIPNPTPEPTTEPISGPITNPTPTPEPITSPVVNPTPEPTPQLFEPEPQSRRPTPTPVPVSPNDITLSPAANTVTVGADTADLNITVPASIAEPALDLTSLRITSPTAASVILNGSINIEAATNLGNIQVQIPSQTMISGPAAWDGRLNMPAVLALSSLQVPAEAGKTTSTSAVVEIGANNTFLTLNKAVRILIPGQAGKLVGYKTGTHFIKITQVCSSDSQEAGNALVGGGDCYINVGSDLVIWTKHFTRFVTYTQTGAQSSSSSSSGNSTSQPQPPICGDSKPTSSPKIISAISAEPNTAVITWSGANDPVSYYLIAYGTKSGKMEYGNPNVGDKTTRSYKVQSLSGGQTYFFKVRAGNGCMSGEFSNEVKVRVSGSKLNSKAAEGFKAGVLAAKVSTPSSEVNLPFKPITSAKPERMITESTSLVSKIVSFIINIFKR